MQESSRKTHTSALLTMPKSLIVYHNKLWQILQEMGIPDHLTCLLRNLYAGQERKKESEVVQSFRLCATPWTAAYQSPSPMGFSRQEYWSGLSFPSPGDLPNPGIEPGSPTLQAETLPSEPQGSPNAGQEATVRAGHGTKDCFQIRKGVHQGYILSPCLFNLYTEYIMRNDRLEEPKLESRLPGEISLTSDMQMTPLLWQKARRNYRAS